MCLILDEFTLLCYNERERITLPSLITNGGEYTEESSLAHEQLFTTRGGKCSPDPYKLLRRNVLEGRGKSGRNL